MHERYHVKEWGEKTWWKPLIIAISAIVITPILVPALGLAVILCAPFAIIAAPVMAVTMYGPDAQRAMREARALEARRQERLRAQRLTARHA